MTTLKHSGRSELESMRAWFIVSAEFMLLPDPESPASSGKAISTSAPEPVAPRAAGRGIVPALVWGAVILVLVGLPFAILSFGFLPPDDALRHAAKAVSGKTWSEILVLRPEITMDHNPGWNWLLTALHRSFHWDALRLVQFSVVSMFLAFTLAPLRWIRRPEAWLASLTLLMIVFPYFAERAFVGRPLFVSVAVTLVLLCLWTRPGLAASPALILASAALMAFAAWVHGSWYLLALVPGAFFLAQEWRRGFHLVFAWGLGSILGALPTGAPVAFLQQSILIPVLALGQNAPVNSLVGEFQPFSGSYPALILIGLVFAWRKLSGRPLPRFWRDPVFCLALLGLLLGFRVLRFWLDWGLPALALWLAREIEDGFGQLPAVSGRRLLVLGGALIGLVLGVANDRDGRWSHFGQFEALDARRPEQAAWLPAPGGILYNVDLAVFYQTFFRNPTGSWRYILGFEPSFMRPEDLEVYQNLWRTLNAVQACAPWVQRMTPADRLVLRGGPRTPPAIPGLEWGYPVANTWLGRRPK